MSVTTTPKYPGSHAKVSDGPVSSKISENLSTKVGLWTFFPFRKNLSPVKSFSVHSCPFTPLTWNLGNEGFKRKEVIWSWPNNLPQFSWWNRRQNLKLRERNHCLGSRLSFNEMGSLISFWKNTELDMKYAREVNANVVGKKSPKSGWERRREEFIYELQKIWESLGVNGVKI